jgi:CheY-like chemotaxis protein
MSGTEATQKIREKYGTTHTPKIIAYTGDRTIGSIIEDKTIFDDFMLKPIKIEQFVGKIFDVFMSCIPQEK